MENIGDSLLCGVARRKIKIIVSFPLFSLELHGHIRTQVMSSVSIICFDYNSIIPLKSVEKIGNYNMYAVLG